VHTNVASRPSSWVWGPSGMGRGRKDNGSWERGGKEDKAYGSQVERKGKGKGRIRSWRGGREVTEPEGEGGLSPKVGGT